MNANKVAGAVLIVAVLCVWAHIFIVGEPKLPVETANGSYSNACCGKLILRNGDMAVANQHVGYVVERDKEGPYVLPNVYVGAAPEGFVVRQRGYSLKLRLDAATHPHRIELIDDRPDGDLYPFSLAGGS